MGIGTHGSGKNCPSWKFWIIMAVVAVILTIAIAGLNNQYYGS